MAEAVAAPADASSAPIVTSKMTMGEIVQKFPQAIPVIQSAGLHCVGCHVSYWETLEDGCRGHMMSEKETEELLSRINEVVSAPPSTQPITVSPAAVEKLKELLSRDGKDGWGLRVHVASGGCAGHSYEMDFEQSGKPGDEQVTEGGLSFFIDSQSLPLVRGAHIDYFDGLKGAGFSIRNPSAQSTCACGSSFS